MNPPYYCLEQRVTGRRFWEKKKEAFAHDLQARPLASIPTLLVNHRVIRIDRRGASHDVCPYSLIEWYQENKIVKDSAFMATHHRSCFRTGAAPLEYSHLIWIKNP